MHDDRQRGRGAGHSAWCGDELRADVVGRGDRGAASRDERGQQTQKCHKQAITARRHTISLHRVGLASNGQPVKDDRVFSVPTSRGTPMRFALSMIALCASLAAA
ncbi:hypothetical protein MTR62_20785, partial [Novosphingobium sp. 1949]